MSIHFIGIGGIGVSALARYYLENGNTVSGSDLRKSEITESLEKKGAKIFIGHKAGNLDSDTSLIIHTSATPQNNPEFVRAKKLKIKTQVYGEALGDLTKKYFTIAISGTHGKSTTTAMTSLVLKMAGLDPTVIVGTKLKEFNNTNCRIGKGKYLIIEADEYKAAFLNYWPKIIALTNIEEDHLDYYKNIDHILKVFKKYINRLPDNGLLVANKDDKNIKNLLNLKCETRNSKQIRNSKSEFFKPKIQYYSLSQKSDIERLKKLLKVPGDHNIQNALAVLSIARILKIQDKIIFNALAQYKGCWRRFEVFNAKIKSPKNLQATSYKLISDYGHHPTEIKATLKGAREKFKNKKIILVFQPHQIKRTEALFADFVKSFDDVDYLILNKIYEVAGREEGKSVSSKDLARAVNERWQKKGYKHKEVVFIENQSNIQKKLSSIIKKNDIVIVMGAGDIYNLTCRLQIK